MAHMVKIEQDLWINSDRIVSVKVYERGQVDPHSGVVLPNRILLIDYDHMGTLNTYRVEVEWIPSVLAALREGPKIQVWVQSVPMPEE